MTDATDRALSTDMSSVYPIGVSRSAGTAPSSTEQSAPYTTENRPAARSPVTAAWSWLLTLT